MRLELCGVARLGMGRFGRSHGRNLHTDFVLDRPEGRKALRQLALIRSELFLFGTELVKVVANGGDIRC